MKNNNNFVNTAPVISELLKKYKIEESKEEIFENFQNVKKSKPLISRGGIILDIAIKIKKGELNKENLISILQKKLNIPRSKARILGKDIEKNLLELIGKSKESQEDFLVDKKKMESEEKKRKKKDTYREKIE